MNQVSEFSIHQVSSFNDKNSKTPSTIEDKYEKKSINETSRQICLSSNQKYRCGQCQQKLSAVTKLKKREIILQYQIQRLKQEIQKLRRQKGYLINLQYTDNKQNLQKYNPSFYAKQDLQSELTQTKYLLQLQLLSKSTLQQINKSKLPIKQSKKQKQSLINLCEISNPFNLKRKCQNLLFQNVKLQQQNMIKDKIIQSRNIFPLYHYDQRILTLRKNVQFWYIKSQQQSNKLMQMMDQVKKMHKQHKRQVKLAIQQQKNYWQTQIYKLKSIIDQNLSKNQYHYDLPLQKKQNILIEDDHTIMSLCEKIKSNKYSKSKLSMLKNQRKNQIRIKDQLIFESKSAIFCENCIKPTKEKKKNQKSCQKNNSSKLQGKYQTLNPNLTKRKQKVNQVSNSVLSQNFANIQIKMAKKDKSQDRKIKKTNINESSKSDQVNCQRCAHKIL